MQAQAGNSFIKDATVEGAPTANVPSTETITERNLFALNGETDPNKDKTREDEELVIASQNIRRMVLVGTAILGEQRYAFLRPPADFQGNSAARTEQFRLTMGDIIEGFSLAEIGERRVVFTRGTSKVELAMDFSRPPDLPRGFSPDGHSAPPVIRRGRLPPPPVPGS
jgi:hypothetical protein